MDKFKILVVEDNYANQLVACAILEHAGYTTGVAGHGKAALEALKTCHYDLVLMDCSMPVMDGFEATRSIRAADSCVLNPEIPIIALTALAMKGDRDRCIEAGMDDYVTKPIDTNYLIGKIQLCLAKNASEESEVWNDDIDLAPTAGSMPGSDHASGTITERSGLDAEFLESILEMFMSEAPMQIAELQSAIKLGDCDKLQHVCHKIRGSSGVLGTIAISNLALGAETASKREDIDAAVLLAKSLIVELQKLLAALADSAE